VTVCVVVATLLDSWSCRKSWTIPLVSNPHRRQVLDAHGNGPVYPGTLIRDSDLPTCETDDVDWNRDATFASLADSGDCHVLEIA